MASHQPRAPRAAGLPTIIGLYSSVPQCGKSSVSGYLSRDYGYAHRAFAEPLKATVGALLKAAGYGEGEVWEALYGGMKEAVLAPFGVPVRRLLQIVGTDCGRNLIDPDIWVNLAMAKVDNSRWTRGFVFDDVRYPNEAAAISKRGGKLVRVVRCGQTFAGSTPGLEGLLELAKFDATILNNGDLVDLRRSVDAMMESWA